MSAFDRAWEIAKDSGPPLNVFNSKGGQESMPQEGWQDFRILSDKEGALAGNFPAMVSHRPARRVVRGPDGLPVITSEPTGSNINLHRMARVMGDERYIMDELASTGRHEAIHQAVHPMLREAGFNHGDRDYERATEWAANLGQHHDRSKAWKKLMEHGVFEGDEEIRDIADRVLGR